MNQEQQVQTLKYLYAVNADLWKLFDCFAIRFDFKITFPSNGASHYLVHHILLEIWKILPIIYLEVFRRSDHIGVAHRSNPVCNAKYYH
jgi:hypothetical protein